jgi:hypothetical protein
MKVAQHILSSADFNLTANPRTEVGTATAFYSMENFETVDAQFDAVAGEVSLVLRDYSQAQYGLYATAVASAGGAAVTDWWAPYVGKQFAPFGQGPDFYNCWGLVRAVYREQLRLDLPAHDEIGAGEHRAVAQAMQQGVAQGPWIMVRAAAGLRRDGGAARHALALSRPRWRDGRRGPGAAHLGRARRAHLTDR